MMAYEETFVQRDQHRIYVRDHPGAEPAIILMHGFPDNVHLYDRLSPYLSPPRRVVLFDFLGWGSSDKPSGYPYTTDNQVGDLDAVITQLGLVQVLLVAHDASGPPAIDWALAHPERRHIFNKAFLEALAADFRKGGPEAIAKVRKYQPAAYMKICALMVPRELKLEHSGGVKAMTDEQIEQAIEVIQDMLAARAGEAAKVIEGTAEPAALPAPEAQSIGAGAWSREQ
jgi:pimeloyl-ACP methyl ester carboxylesterase